MHGVSVDEADLSREWMNRTPLLTMTACLMAACGSDATSPSNATVVGTWSLFSYDGGGLPATISQNATGKVEFIDDVFVLTADLKYVETGHVRTTPTNGPPTTTTQGDAGTYADVNGTVTLMSASGNGVDMGTIAGNRMTILLQGHALVYVRGTS